MYSKELFFSPLSEIWTW